MENVGGIFRARRVGEWLRATAGEDIRGTGGLAEGKGTVMALDGCVPFVVPLLSGLTL